MKGKRRDRGKPVAPGVSGRAGRKDRINKFEKHGCLTVEYGHTLFYNPTNAFQN
jgi:hypothetical protein